jgi:hypothetical protein
MRRPAFRLTYANVTSTLALVLAMSGGAYAVTTLAPKSVGTVHLKSGAVTAPKVASNAVTAPKIAGNAVSSGKVANGSLLLTDFAAGQLFRWRGPWSAGAAYQKMDVVADGGSTYVATVANTGVPTSEAATWTLLAARGQDGGPGQDGAPGPSFGDTTTANNASLDPCGSTVVASLPLHLGQTSRVLGLTSGYWTVSGTPVSWFVNQQRWIQVVNGGGTVVAQTLARSGSLTNGGSNTADLGIDNLVFVNPATPVLEVPEGDYTIRLRVQSGADNCPGSTYTPKAWEVQFGYVIVGNTP